MRSRIASLRAAASWRCVPDDEDVDVEDAALLVLVRVDDVRVVRVPDEVVLEPLPDACMSYKSAR